MTLSLLISKNHQDFQNDSLVRSEVEFVGIINEKGRLVETIGKDLLCDMPRDRKEMFCMKIALRSSMQKDFDEYLGPVNYCMTQRGKAQFISIPAVNGNTILVITKKKVEPEVVVGYVTQMLQGSNQFGDKKHQKKNRRR
jgi:hypothetical protein